MRGQIVSLLGVSALLAACSYHQIAGLDDPDRPHWEPSPLSEEALVRCGDLNLDPEVIADLHRRPIYTFEPREVDMYLRFVRSTVPDLRERTVLLGRKNIGQRYDIFLLGEFPYEVHDPQPMFSLKSSDCVVFSEHTYSMALGHDWPSFFEILQDIRYRDGEVGIQTRNHWTLADWNSSNDWLVEDLTTELGGGEQWSEIHQTLRRRQWFQRRFGLAPDIPDEELTFTYIPLENLENVLTDLRDGDWVNVIRGSEPNGWAGHTGLIAIGEDGTVDFLHSSRPYVREEPLVEYARRAQERNERNAENPPQGRTYHPTIGFKFLRLRAEELAEAFQVTDTALVRPQPE
jgi:hypothetical protein